jgi:hypothetical protein
MPQTDPYEIELIENAEAEAVLRNDVGPLAQSAHGNYRSSLRRCESLIDLLSRQRDDGREEIRRLTTLAANLGEMRKTRKFRRCLGVGNHR